MSRHRRQRTRRARRAATPSASAISAAAARIESTWQAELALGRYNPARAHAFARSVGVPGLAPLVVTHQRRDGFLVLESAEQLTQELEVRLSSPCHNSADVAGLRGAVLDFVSAGGLGAAEFAGTGSVPFDNGRTRTIRVPVWKLGRPNVPTSPPELALG